VDTCGPCPQVIEGGYTCDLEEVRPRTNADEPSDQIINTYSMRSVHGAG